MTRLSPADATAHEFMRWWAALNIALTARDQDEALWGDVHWRFHDGHTVEDATAEIVKARERRTEL